MSREELPDIQEEENTQVPSSQTNKEKSTEQIWLDQAARWHLKMEISEGMLVMKTYQSW